MKKKKLEILNYFESTIFRQFKRKAHIPLISSSSTIRCVSSNVIFLSKFSFLNRRYKKKKKTHGVTRIL